MEKIILGIFFFSGISLRYSKKLHLTTVLIIVFFPYAENGRKVKKSGVKLGTDKNES